MEKVFLIFMIIAGIGGLGMCLFSVWEYFKSKKYVANMRVAFTDDSIIGPLWTFWKKKEGEIKFTEITDIKIYQTRLGILLVISSLSQTLRFEKVRLRAHDFVEVYNLLAEKTNRPSFEASASESIKNALQPFQSQFNSARSFFYGLFYLIILCVFTYLFESNMQLQIDSTYMYMPSTLIHFLVLIFMIGIIWRAPLRRNSTVSKMFFTAFVGLLGFISLIGFWGLLSFLNQLGDTSDIEKQVSTLIKSEGQSEDRLRIYGQCYEVAHFEEKDHGIGGDIFCQKNFPSIAEHTKVEVQYKKGNFSQRWAVKFTLLE